MSFLFDHNSTIPLLILILFMATACQKRQEEDIRPDNQTTPFELEIPNGFPVPEIPESNPTTRKGVKLGRTLYYDNLLSKGGPLEGKSCSSCHQQKNGFSSKGTTVLPHINLAWNRAFLWKGDIVGNLEEIMRFEVEDFFQADLDHIRQTQNYPRLYQKAFGSEKITIDRTAKALAQFIRTITSSNSKLDRYLRGKASLTPSEANGLTLFNSEKGDCFHCHNLRLFTDGEFHNIGLDTTYLGLDKGRFLVTGDSTDIGKFKTPTLRNVALRPPYMHDGRFQSLIEVVEHYNSGVKRSTTLAPVLVNPGQDLQLHLTYEEKLDLVAFLKTLTDSTFINEPKFGKP